MNKNGKIIKCKVCKAELYISASRFSFKKYCSTACAIKDNFGFKPRTKKCVICGNAFLITKGIQGRKKTCSNNCRLQNARNISRKRGLARSEKKCQICGNLFISLKYIGIGKLCQPCRFKKLSSERLGRNNPNYSSGAWQGRKKRSKPSQSGVHLYACAKYKREFLKKFGYLFCEVCKVSGEARYNTHHIYFASRYPKHKNLHNQKNLILVCLACHQRFHSGNDYKDVFSRLERVRGLKELFK